MTSRPDGNFDVDANEQINITIIKSLPNCEAGIRLTGATLSCQPTQFPTCKQCSFTAPGTSGAQVTLAMSFDFQSDAQGNFANGDKYTLTFSGAGGSTVPAIDIFPPPALAMVFIFFVR
ncbi:MAG: hypothetical protein ABSA96_20825 [Candidatus Acidiferrales bacterium]|jgi:hypothetical protein